MAFYIRELLGCEGSNWGRSDSKGTALGSFSSQVSPEGTVETSAGFQGKVCVGGCRKNDIAKPTGCMQYQYSAKEFSLLHFSTFYNKC